MTTRRRAAVIAAAVLALAGCTSEPPDYQTVWSTTSPAPSTSPADADTAPKSIATYLEEQGVGGQPVAPDKLTDLVVTMPTPAGWRPYQNTNLAPGTRMIAKGDTYPTAMLLVFALDGDFDTAQALTHADVDARSTDNFTELNTSKADFNGFPSSMIEGSYDLANDRMHSYNRIVIATGTRPAAQRYLVQFTVTGYADKAAEEAPDMETIIEGFTVRVP